MAGIKRKLNGNEAPSEKKLKTKEGNPKHKALSKTNSGAEYSDGDSVDPEGFEGLESDVGSQAYSDDEEGGMSKDRRNRLKESTGKNSTSQNATTSKESHAKQKALVQERKAAKPNADQIQRSKKIWERLRLKSHVPLEERRALVAELFDIITGRVKEFVLKHDAVRVIQCALKYASLEQRKTIARELKGEYVHLSKGRYSKHLIDKLLIHGDREVQELIVPEFYGNVRRLLRHPEGAWVIDDIYRAAADRNQKAVLLREWYGPEFFIFKTEKDTKLSSKLSDILAEAPEKRTPIMRYLLEFINHLVQTNRTAFTMLHDAMLEYFDNVKPGSEEATNFIEVVKGDDEGNLLKSLAFDKSGARVICLALAYGTAKDRKTILKAFKDEEGKVIPELAADKGGYLVLITAFEVLDDTVLTTKTLLTDLIGKDTALQSNQICQMALHPVARLVFLNLLAGSESSIDETKAPRTPLPKDDQVFLDRIMEIRSTTSKKAPALRKQELLKSVSAALLATVENMTMDLLADKQGWGCRFITEVLLRAQGEKTTALEAVAIAAEGDPRKEGHISSSTPAGKMYKTLVVGGIFDKELGKIKACTPSLCFSDILYSHIEDHVVDWAITMSSFVVVNMVEADDFHRRTDLLQKLLKRKSELMDASKRGNAGAKMLVQKMIV